MPTLYFDATQGRYRSADGRYVSDAVARAELDAFLAKGTERVQALTRSMQAGQISIADWQQQMVSTLKSLHLTAATIAQGGTAQMSPAAYGRVGQRLRQEYGYLRTYAEQIANGQQVLDGRVLVRSELYAQSARGTFEDTRRAQQQVRGFREERRVLHAAEHCVSCSEAAARGWQRIGTLPRIGQGLCRSRCRCTMVYRRGEAA